MTTADVFPKELAVPRLLLAPQFEAVPVAGHAHHRHVRTLRRRRYAVMPTLVNGRVLAVSDPRPPPAPTQAPPAALHGTVSEKVRAALARVRAAQRREP